ncbi:claudin-23-like [Eucyclogobius newberryi]|uniref:claudin-23-like n=1 Tax=Eucyclogobius newberryi TaxID=166745 RepID=UPI003B593BA6
MPNRRAQEWIRMTQRTPGILIFGLVLSPCGWVLDLTATVAPNWRTLHDFANKEPQFVLQQGIFDICSTTLSSTRNDCGQPDSAYYANEIINIAQGMMVASLVVTLIGLAVAIPGVRCWRDNPNWTVAGLGGLLIFCSGVLTIIPIAWYTHTINDLNTSTPTSDVRVGYCIVLGYIGGIFEVLAGFVMFIGICRCCKGRNRGEVRADRAAAKFNHQKEPPRRPVPAPSLSRPRSEASSVPYSKNYMDDDVSFPRAKSAVPSVNTLDSGMPYDADL